MKLPVYFIPGMGLDERLFSRLELPSFEMRYIKWLTPLKNETLPDYAKRLAEQINTSQPFILAGVSFGGMCAAEISRHLNPVATILISSASSFYGIPKYFRLFKNLPVRDFRDSFWIGMAYKFRKKFGVETKEEAELFLAMLNSCPENYFGGAVDCLLNWKREKRPAGLFHIHGSRDEVLPEKLSKADKIIKGGTHLMVLTKPVEVSRAMNDYLSVKCSQFLGRSCPMD